MGIELADHIVIGNDGVFSFKRKIIIKEPYENAEVISYITSKDNPNTWE